MTYSLTALIALLLGLFFLALSGPGWGMCLSPGEAGVRARAVSLPTLQPPRPHEAAPRAVPAGMERRDQG